MMDSIFRKMLHYKFRFIAIAILTITLFIPLTQIVQAQDGAPAATTAPNQAATSLPWYVGVLFFVAVAVGGTIFKARIAAGTKKQFTSGSCCAPLVDEDRKS